MSRVHIGTRPSRLVRAALVLGGILGGLLTVEATLQAGAAIVRFTTPPGQAPAGSGRLRVLTLGDSNTFGHLVGRDQAYPMQFERIWNETNPARPALVFNAGYPGTNSSQVLSLLRQTLSSFRPDVVTVMIGANDFWTQPDAVSVVGRSAASEQLEDRPRSLWKASRLFRLLYMVAQSTEEPRLEIKDPLVGAGATEADRAGLAGEGRDQLVRDRLIPLITNGRALHGSMHYGELEIGIDLAAAPPGGNPDWQARLIENLRQTIGEIRANGAEPIFVTYPGGRGASGIASSILRASAHRMAVPLLDLEPTFHARCPEWQCSELFPDQHPTMVGHVLAAQLLADRFASVVARRPAAREGNGG